MIKSLSEINASTFRTYETISILHILKHWAPPPLQVPQFWGHIEKNTKIKFCDIQASISIRPFLLMNDLTIVRISFLMVKNTENANFRMWYLIKGRGTNLETGWWRCREMSPSSLSILNPKFGFLDSNRDRIRNRPKETLFRWFVQFLKTSQFYPFWVRNLDFWVKSVLDQKSDALFETSDTTLIFILYWIPFHLGFQSWWYICPPPLLKESNFSSKMELDHVI